MAMERDVFDFFEGKRKGVIERFARVICDALQKTNAYDAIKLEEHVGLSPGMLGKIAVDPDRFINSEVIQALADPFDIDINACFVKATDIKDEIAEAWSREADEENFVAIAGANNVELSHDDRLQLYMILRALRELDKP